MPTDIARVHSHNIEAQVSKPSLTIVCLWTVVGLVLAALIFRFGYDAEMAEALLTAAG
jgi:hypothetical protein